MKDLHARASAATQASIAAATALLRDLERYPHWYPDGVRSVQALERGADGTVSRVRAKLHLSQGPLQRDFELVLSVAEPRPGTIVLAREPHELSDPERFTVTWQVRKGEISLALEAALEMPRLLPVGAIGDSLARGFVSAAARALER